MSRAYLCRCDLQSTVDAEGLITVSKFKFCFCLLITKNIVYHLCLPELDWPELCVPVSIQNLTESGPESLLGSDILCEHPVH